MFFQSLTSGMGFKIFFVQGSPLAHPPFHFLDAGNLPAARTAVSLPDNVKACGSAAVLAENTKGILLYSVFIHSASPLSKISNQNIYSYG
jgi:hypothetical protein